MVKAVFDTIVRQRQEIRRIPNNSNAEERETYPVMKSLRGEQCQNAMAFSFAATLLACMCGPIFERKRRRTLLGSFSGDEGLLGTPLRKTGLYGARSNENSQNPE